MRRGVVGVEVSGGEYTHSRNLIGRMSKNVLQYVV
jgi:hypothetical protein